MNKHLTPARIVTMFAVLVGLLVGWRFLSPYNLPWAIEMIGQDALKLLHTPYFYIGQLGVTPILLLKLLVFLLFLVYLTGWIRRLFRRRVLDLLPFDEGQRFVIERLFSYAIFGIGLVVALQSAGVHLDSLLALGAAVGIGIGLGLQTIAKNFASGLILLLERPIKVGDRVAVGDLLGDVLHIGGRSTWIRTNDNVVIIVPNAEFIEQQVINWTANDRKVRIVIPLGVAYSSDPEEVRKILLDLAYRHPDVLNGPAADVVFRGFGDSSLDFELRIWTTKQVQTPKIITSDLYFAIFKAFRNHGIEIPFPQRDLHLKSVHAPLSWSADSADVRVPAA